ncbi:MAG: RnfABCDGE type electron transport complex subunit B [Candidatus Omnitrophica bacterium]|nr:RnfABCDGE type electron transport complex subunit B [Candidatus Omnitrophota bacterium]MBU1933414.1 RnfABCDGE type electron transport complex subunit B [Candidatus Omnitrophota bacterium]
MLIPILIMSCMGLLFGLGLAFASNIFRVELDPRIERILGALPGANCGACGKAGCAGLAEAIAKGDMSFTSCPAGGEEAYNQIAEIMGVEKETVARKVARVKCGGGNRAKNKYEYKGVGTCAAASLIAGGEKLCNFGCLGFGDCVKACPFDAIYMGKEGVPVVDAGKCTACGKCVSGCPKNIISLEKASEAYYVKCLSRDKASLVSNACKAGCIACKICEKLSKGAFTVEDNLSRLDYGKVDNEAVLKLCAEKCPTKCIIQL